MGSLISVRNALALSYGSYRRNRKYENKSSTLFCSGVPERHQRHFASTALTAAATCDRAFLTLCASSRTTLNHSTPPMAPPGSGGVGFDPPTIGEPKRSAGATASSFSPPTTPTPPKLTSKPTTANVVSTTSYSARSDGSFVRPTPWCTSTRKLAAAVSLLSSSRCHCLSTLVGHTTRVPPPGFLGTPASPRARHRGGGGFAAMSAMALKVLPKPWSSARSPPLGDDPSCSRFRIQTTARFWCRKRGIASMLSGMFKCSSSSSPALDAAPSSPVSPSSTVSMAAAVFAAVAFDSLSVGACSATPVPVTTFVSSTKSITVRSGVGGVRTTFPRRPLSPADKCEFDLCSSESLEAAMAILRSSRSASSCPREVRVTRPARPSSCFKRTDREDVLGEALLSLSPPRSRSRLRFFETAPGSASEPCARSTISTSTTSKSLFVALGEAAPPGRAFRVLQLASKESSSLPTTSMRGDEELGDTETA